MLTLIAAGNLSVLVLALVAQHLMGMQPCAWCIVQRIDVLMLLLVSLSGATLARVLPRAAPALSGLMLMALSAGGLWAAWHQHTVAAKQLSCAFTWADRTLMTLSLDAWWPAVFEVRATCADAAQAVVFGLPFELWSAGWFAMVMMASFRVLLLGLQSRSRLPVSS
ncbi:MAG: disulfide bond formation protein B [Burkholderiaceae bacterium]